MVSQEKVLLGMSGGTDSSIAALVLQKKGYKVIGVTFRFYEKEGETSYLEKAKKCADLLGIEHRIVDCRDLFEKKVIRYFIDEYMRGATPVPCTVCNTQLKWPLLYQIAQEEQIEWIATGHYAQLKVASTYSCICKGKDPDKDQSFFLWDLPQTILSKICLPLGGYTKQEVRELALANGLKQFSKQKESVSLCFCPHNYQQFLLERVGKETIQSGFFKNSEGVVLGKHTGYPFYTVGQRRGLGINFQMPTYVKEIIPQLNEVILSSIKELYKDEISLAQYRLVMPIIELPSDGTLICKIRYRKQGTPCRLFIRDNQLIISLLEPLHAIAKGQAAVIYWKEKVVAGGIILTASNL